jgi:hypothetical protein
MAKNKQSLLQTFSALVSRAKLMSKLGQQYGGDRDVYEALGYPKILTCGDYASRYERQDMAAAVINIPVGDSWRGGFEIVENTEDKTTRKPIEKTIFEKEWSELSDNLKISSKLTRVDRIAGLGQYAVLFLGFDDVKTSLDFIKPVSTSGKRQLLYIKPLGENNATINSLDNNTNSPRYSMPETYNISISTVGSSSTADLKVHHTRIIHINPGTMMESEIEGLPRLKNVFNRLMDLEKCIGGSAEMFWRGGRPGYQGKVDDEYDMSDTERDDLEDQVDEYEHNLRRMLILKGIKLESLAQQVVDPKNTVDVQVQMISTVTRIPKRILTGSERGELASTGDKDSWLETCQTRREEYINPEIVWPLIDRLITYKVLSMPKAGKNMYTVVWADLFVKGEKDKADIGKVRSDALAAYTRSPYTQEVVLPEDFFKIGLALSDEQIEEMSKRKIKMIIDEDEDIVDDQINV